MSDGFKVQLDMSGWDKTFAVLDGPLKDSLARRMLVEGGVLLRDKAKAAAPKSDGPYRAYPGHGSQRSQASGTLAASIYLALDTDESVIGKKYVYKVTWNNTKAWWGRLVEFGWWQTHEIHRDRNGEFYTDMSKPLAEPKWHGPQPFLRPTIANYGAAAVDAMLERGRREFPELLKEHGL